MRRRPYPAGDRSFVRCDAPGCDVKIKRGMLLCRSLWFQLPRALRIAISTSWQERRTRGMATWSANVLAARAFLAGNSPAANAARITGEQ